MIKSRFCPSPTGRIHLGNARTALFNVLAAKEGVFLLRIEDTDKSRSYEEHTQSLLDDLKWLGMQWQEGPGIEGEHGPYWQSKRQPIYDKYYEVLLEGGQAYSCYCSDEELVLNRKIQLANNQPPRYPGTCRELSEDARIAKEREGCKPTLRYHMREDETVEFDDIVKGRQTYRAAEIGDFIIRRADGSSPFMYANAIDDSLMEVTVALRGEDHLTNTPRQVSLLNALDLGIPRYGHISLILGEDGAPLSKRNGSRSVNDLREAGYLSLAVVNYLARLGHYYADDALLTFDELQDKFDFENLSSSPARFDEAQLKHWQKQAVLAADLETIKEWLGEALLDKVPSAKLESFLKLVHENCLFPSEAKGWFDTLFNESVYPADAVLEAIKTDADKHFFETACQALQENSADFAKVSAVVKETCGVRGKKLFMPFRLALTGQSHGPELGLILELIGVELAQARFQHIVSHW